MVLRRRPFSWPPVPARQALGQPEQGGRLARSGDGSAATVPFRHARTGSTAVRFTFGAGCAPTLPRPSRKREGRRQGDSPSPQRGEGRGEGGCRRRDVDARCHPGLVPGDVGRQRCPTVWTPERVRGDTGRQGRLVRACGNPSPDRRCRRSPRPPHIPSWPDLFRPSTSFGIAARAGADSRLHGCPGQIVAI